MPPLFGRTGIVPPTAPLVPSDIADCVLWLRADLGITKDGADHVSQWADQSGKGNHAAQATPDYQPLWKDAHLNGKPVVYFDHADDYLLANGLATKGYFAGVDKPLTMVCVMTMEKLNVNDTYYGAIASLSSTNVNGANWAMYYLYNYALNWGTDRWDDAFNTKNASGATLMTSQEDMNNPVILSYLFNGTNLSVWINNILKCDNADLNVGTAALDTAFSIGCLYEGQGSWRASFHWGDIPEFIVYKSALSEADRLWVQNYLNTRYAIY